MSDVVTVEGATTELTPSSPAAGIAEAGAALRATGWDVPAEPAAPVVAEAPAPETPVAEPDATGEPTYTMDDAGRWHRPDGKFADAEEIAKLDALPVEGAEIPAVPEEAQPEPIVVKLRARDGSDAEIEVTDEKVAELLRANHNDGMRREEFTRRMETVESKEAELREFETMLRTNPEAVILQRLPQDKKVAIATALVAELWDHIYPNLVGFEQDPTARVTAAMQSQLAIRDQQSQYQQAITTAQYSAKVYSTLHALVPESVDDATRDSFLADAASDVARAIEKNGKQPVPVESLKQILAPRLALYRFQAESPINPVPSQPARPVARPLTAAKAAVPSVPVHDQAKAGATVRRTVQAQRIAAAIAPQGAGAATVKSPLVPSNADVTAAGQAMRTQKGWGLTPS